MILVMGVAQSMKTTQEIQEVIPTLENCHEVWACGESVMLN